MLGGDLCRPRVLVSREWTREGRVCGGSNKVIVGVRLRYALITQQRYDVRVHDV